MENETLNNLTKKELELFDKIAKAYAYNDIPILMADHVAQRGGILSEFVAHGGRAYIAGGQKGQQFFSNVPQFTLNYDTFTNRDPSTIRSITSLFPRSIVSQNFATFCYTPLGDRLWARGIQEQVGGTMVASSEQNFRSYFEEKTNLVDILKMAGLQKNIIPSKILRNKGSLTPIEASFLYEKLKSPDGKLVLQRCGEGNTEKGGGKSTEVVESLKEFQKIVCTPRESYLKIATYITGCNSNLSMCVGNTVPSQTMLGSAKGELLPQESRFLGSTLFSLLDRAKALGINHSNIVVNVQPATLKVVGCKELSSSSTNGVGNQLNYNFSPEIMEEIYSMGYQLGSFMAMCGKVGMCGLDLIITKDGHVYVNELNDRQQGPTESASLNNELNGLPGIHRESFIMNYADVSNPEVKAYLEEMNKHSREIYYASSQIPSPFYLKMHTLKDCVCTQNVTAGDYVVEKDENGSTTWDLSSSKDLPHTPCVDITAPETLVRINTVSAKEGDFFPQDAQFLRINGISTPETAPFTIDENGVSVLSDQWKEPIAALYKTLLTPVQTENQTDSKFDQDQNDDQEQ